jgi:hypothetical protein
MSDFGMLILSDATTLTLNGAGSLWRKTGITHALAKRAGRGGVKSPPTILRVLHVLQVRPSTGAEQRRQYAQNLAEVLQKLSV